MRKISVVFLLLGLLWCVVSGAQTFQTRNHFGGWSNHAVAVDNYVFLSAGSSIMVLDMGLEDPQQVASLLLPGEPNRFFLEGDYIYIACGWQGFQIVDISNPLAPELVGGRATAYMARDLAVAGGKAYVALCDSGLAVYDVTDPTAPDSVMVLNINAVAVSVAGDYAYVLEEGFLDSRLHVVELSPAETPVVTGSVDVEGASAVTVMGQFAYVACGFSPGMDIVDISDPASPRVAGHYTQGYRGYFDVAVFQGSAIACLPNRDAGLALVDVSDPANPVEKAVLADVLCEKLWIDYPNLYTIMGGDKTLHVVDLSDANNPLVTHQYVSPSAFDCQFIEDDWLYVGTWQSLFVFDMTTPLLPSLVRYYADTPTSQVFADDGLCYTVSDNDLVVFDNADPLSMTELGRITCGSANALFALDSLVYLLTGDSLIIVDASDPSALQRAGSLALNGGRDLFVRPGSATIFAAADNGLHVINGDDPAVAVELQTVATFGAASCVWVRGDTAWVGSNLDDEFVLQTFNVVDRGDVQLLHQTQAEAGQIGDIEVTGKAAYAAISSHSGVYLYHTARLIPGERTQGSASLVSVHRNGGLTKTGDNDDETAASSDESQGGDTSSDNDDSGIDPHHNTGLDEFRLCQNYPNPFNPETVIRFTVRQRCRVVLKVFDVLGREVAVPVNTVAPAGNHQVRFNAAHLPTGVYLYQIRMKDFTETKKMVVIE